MQRLPERIERLERTLRYLRTADAVVRGNVPRTRTLVHLGDELLGDVVHARQTDTGAKVAKAVTELGEWTTHTTVIASAALLPSRHTQRRRAALQATLAMVGCSIAYTTVKSFVRRARPHPSRHLVTVHDSSFPSGHTATAAAAAETLADLFGLPRVPLYALAAGVGFTRVYLGVHHPSDVLAGLVLGVAWARGAGLLADALPLPEDGTPTDDAEDPAGDDDADDGQLALTIAFDNGAHDVRRAGDGTDADADPPVQLRRVAPPDGDHPSLY